MSLSDNISAELLRELLRYEPETGRLFWRPRQQCHFKSRSYCDRWNAKYAGKEAFTTVTYGYYAGTVMCVTLRAHRVAWAMHYGEWPAHGIDHIDHDRKNNRIDNLRDVARSENNKNISFNRRNKSGVFGVNWMEREKKWRVYIGLENRFVHLGYFQNFDDACAARYAANKTYGYHDNHGVSA